MIPHGHEGTLYPSCVADAPAFDTDADGDSTDVVLAGLAGAPAQGRELRARGRRTLGKLLDAGREVFATRGYHSARVDDVVKAAKTSHGTFYLYFSNKEDLFRALALDVANDMTRLAEELGEVTPDDDGFEAIRTWLEKFLDLYGQHGPVIRAWTEAGPETLEFGRLGIEVLGGFGQVLADRVREASSESVDPDIASIAFIAMIERFHYFWTTAELDLDREAVLDTLASLVHVGFFAGERRPRRRLGRRA